MNRHEYDETAKVMSQRRICALVDECFDGSKKDFADAVGVSRASVTQYTTGTNAPGNVSAAKIAKYFHLNPLWIMGFDVTKEISEERSLTMEEAELVDKFRSLSADQKNLILTTIEMLSK